MYELTIQVRKDHEDNGIKGNYNKCMFALAFHEYFPGSYPSVAGDRVVVYLNDEHSRSAPILYFSFGQDVEETIYHFDNGNPVTLGSFVFTLAHVE